MMDDKTPKLYSFRDEKDTLFETDNYEVAYDKQVHYMLGDRKSLNYKIIFKTDGVTIRDFGHETIRLHIIDKSFDNKGTKNV